MLMNRIFTKHSMMQSLKLQTPAAKTFSLMITKMNFKKLLTILFAIGTMFYSRNAFAVTYYYVGAGSPSVTTSWNTDSVTFLGASPASFAGAGDIFILMSGQTTSTTVGWILSGAGQQLIVRNGATLNAPFSITIPATGTFQIDDGGTYNHNN